MEATGMVLLPGWLSWVLRRRFRGAPLTQSGTRATVDPTGESGRLDPKCSEGLFEVRREGRADVHGLARDRVREGEAGGVEELALEAELGGTPVQRVAGHGKVDSGEMNPNLVRPARLQRHAEECVSWKELLHLEVCDRVARCVCVERVAERVVAVAADRRVDRPLAGARPPVGER